MVMCWCCWCGIEVAEVTFTHRLRWRVSRRERKEICACVDKASVFNPENTCICMWRYCANVLWQLHYHLLQLVADKHTDTQTHTETRKTHSDTKAYTEKHRPTDTYYRQTHMHQRHKHRHKHKHRLTTHLQNLSKTNTTALINTTSWTCVSVCAVSEQGLPKTQVM